MYAAIASLLLRPLKLTRAHTRVHAWLLLALTPQPYLQTMMQLCQHRPTIHAAAAAAAAAVASAAAAAAPVAVKA
jgi:hypothetical protein